MIALAISAANLWVKTVYSLIDTLTYIKATITNVCCRKEKVDEEQNIEYMGQSQLEQQSIIG